MAQDMIKSKYDEKPTFRQWFKILLSGKPHFVIGSERNPYLLRWFIIPRNRVLNIYLHKFLRSDDDRALHDHPWWFLSVIVKGKYNEVVPALDSNFATHDVIHRSAPSIAFRRSEHRHRVALIQGKPCWTIIITGPKSRTWGFWCEGKRFVPWYEFTSPTEDGNEVGRGCE